MPDLLIMIYLKKLFGITVWEIFHQVWTLGYGNSEGGLLKLKFLGFMDIPAKVETSSNLNLLIVPLSL